MTPDVFGDHVGISGRVDLDPSVWFVAGEFAIAATDAAVESDAGVPRKRRWVSPEELSSASRRPSPVSGRDVEKDCEVWGYAIGG